MTKSPFLNHTENYDVKSYFFGNQKSESLFRYPMSLILSPGVRSQFLESVCAKSSVRNQSRSGKLQVGGLSCERAYANVGRGLYLF